MDGTFAGSLAAALQHALVTQGSKLTAERPLDRWFALGTGDDRQCQVMMAALHRSFTSDFSHRGVGYGRIWEKGGVRRESTQVAEVPTAPAASSK